jgi:diadenosine tetraphosphate (Ap4A) HIT family hydrolase
MRRAYCISCNTVEGRRQPPGGILYQDDYWVFFLRSRPLLIPGQAFIVLKRHCERLSELTPAELSTLGPMMERAEYALDQVLKPAKIHFGLYGEAVQHIHLHVFPRMPNMPEGNIPVTLLNVWYDVLCRIGLRHAYSDEVVAGVARRLRDTLQATKADGSIDQQRGTRTDCVWR